MKLCLGGIVICFSVPENSKMAMYPLEYDGMRIDERIAAKLGNLERCKLAAAVPVHAYILGLSLTTL